MEAFARAMLDAIERRDPHVTFRLRFVGGPELDMPCRDFLSCRPEEEAGIGTALRSVSKPVVLDIGCGVGRHLQYVRSIKPQAQLVGVEISTALRETCVRELPNVKMLEDFSKVTDDPQFDLVLLMGNGLGIFGTEQNTSRQLRRIRGLLTEEGSVLIEAGNPFGGEFRLANHEIEYCGQVDGPFPWGYASDAWLTHSMRDAGFHIETVCPSRDHAPFFILHARST